MAANLDHLRETQRLAVRLLTSDRWILGFAVLMIGLSLLGLGFLTWHTLAHREESAALMQAVLTNTQTIEAQTRALLEGRQSR
jgi:hypothetical protein